MTRPPRRSILVVALLALVAVSGCAGGRGSAVPNTHPEAPTVGVYQGRFEVEEGRGRRFKLLLFAALPDRIHAEVLSPLGRTEVILDGGAGRMAVTIVPEGVSFVGEGHPGCLEPILGVPVGLEELVRGLLIGESIDTGYSVDRSGGLAGKLPERLEIRTPSSRLSLQIKKSRRMTVPMAGLGTGQPPEGTERRPIEELATWEYRTAEADSS